MATIRIAVVALLMIATPGPASAQERQTLDEAFDQAYTLAEIASTLGLECKSALQVSMDIALEPCKQWTKFYKSKGQALMAVLRNSEFHQAMVENAERQWPMRARLYMINVRNALDYMNFINEYLDSYSAH